MAFVLTETVRPGVVVVTLNRPEKLNAMSLDEVRELGDVLEELGRDTSCRAIVLTGAGRGFCAGHDLGDFTTADGDLGEGLVQLGWHHQKAFADLTVKLRDVPHPVIAAVNGPAAGGGLALALAADTRVCAESAKFNAAFIRLGISGCDVGVSYLLPKIVGPTLAFEMMLTGRLVDAQEALAAGLVLRVVPDGEIVDAALEIAERICANAPFAVRMTKEVMWTNLDAPSLEAAIDLENRTQILCTQTKDQREAVAAFVGKRAPSFEDR
jgi:enoyl-CoA hydratase